MEYNIFYKGWQCVNPKCDAFGVIPIKASQSDNQ